MFTWKKSTSHRFESDNCQTDLLLIWWQSSIWKSTSLEMTPALKNAHLMNKLACKALLQEDWIQMSFVINLLRGDLPMAGLVAWPQSRNINPLMTINQYYYRITSLAEACTILFHFATCLQVIKEAPPYFWLSVLRYCDWHLGCACKKYWRDVETLWVVRGTGLKGKISQ